MHIICYVIFLRGRQKCILCDGKILVKNLLRSPPELYPHGELRAKGVFRSFPNEAVSVRWVDPLVLRGTGGYWLACVTSVFYKRIFWGEMESEVKALRTLQTENGIFEHLCSLITKGTSVPWERQKVEYFWGFLEKVAFPSLVQLLLYTEVLDRHTSWEELGRGWKDREVEIEKAYF